MAANDLKKDELEKLSANQASSSGAETNDQKVARHDQEIAIHSKKLDLTLNVMSGILIVLFLGFLSLLFTYFQSVKDSYKEYNALIRLYTDERFKLLEDKIQQIEIKIIPTPTP